jgi:hypothetical protein
MAWRYGFRKEISSRFAVVLAEEEAAVVATV